MTPARQASAWPNIISIQAIETATTKLYPFRPSTEAWYDSNAVKQVEDFGYTYEEIAGSRIPITDKTALKKKVIEKYPSAALRFRQSLDGIPQAEEALFPKARFLKREAKIDRAPAAPAADESTTVLKSQLEQPQNVLKAAAVAVQDAAATVKDTIAAPKETDATLKDAAPAHTTRRLKDLVKDDRYLEWLVNIKAEKHALGGSYSVGVFLGAADEFEPALWEFSPHYVGAFAPFGQGAETSCAKCQDAQRDNLNVTGQIPLTLALMERYLVNILPDLDPQTVTRYLVENLHWRVRKVCDPTHFYTIRRVLTHHVC